MALERRARQVTLTEANKAHDREFVPDSGEARRDSVHHDGDHQPDDDRNPGPARVLQLERRERTRGIRGRRTLLRCLS